MTTADRKKLNTALIYSLTAGCVGVIIFIMIENRSLSLGDIVGGFLMTFMPVLLIMLFQQRVSSRYLVRLHGVYYLLINSIVNFIILFLVMISVILLFDLSPDYESGKIGIDKVITHPDTLTGLVFLAITIVIIQFFVLIDSFLGRGMLIKLLFGIYHKPQKKDKIFMFLDVKSSTNLAEKTGDISFLALLQDFFFDLNEAAAEHNGEIYKYVGDEAIVVWNIDNPDKNIRCIDFFYSLKEKITARQNHYMKKYGVLPEFKAGVHCGRVVMGEIGMEKKEITYMGDVINTAARIESLCNEYNADLLVSEQVFESVDIKKKYHINKTAEVVLRGKEKSTTVFEILCNEEV